MAEPRFAGELRRTLTGALPELDKLNPGPVPVNTENCISCGSETKAQDIPYTYEWQLSETFGVTIAKSLPGSRCVNVYCDIPYMQTNLRENFLDAVAMGLSRLGDNTLLRERMVRASDPSNYRSFSPDPRPRSPRPQAP